MMPEICNLLVALRPLPTCSVAQKTHLHESLRTANVNNQKQAPRRLPSRHQSQRNKLKQWHQVKPFRLLPSLQGNYDNFHEYVDESGNRKENLLDYPLQKRILGQYPQIVDQRLKGLYFVIQKRVGEGMVTQTVHALPLFMGKPSDQPQISKGMPPHVDEIVSHAQKGKQRDTAEHRHKI